jgi:hypothetical protein
MHPTEGGRDFGTGKSISPINVIIAHGGAANPVQAALWLCDQIPVDPATLGWKGKPRKDQPMEVDIANPDDFEKTEDGAYVPKTEDGIALAFTSTFKDLFGTATQREHGSSGPGGDGVRTKLSGYSIGHAACADITTATLSGMTN